MENWKLITSVYDHTQAQLIQGMLSSEGIKTVLLNKKDSMYGTFGAIEIYVQSDDVMQALRLLNAADEDG